jgi:hypothetical protein
MMLFASPFSYPTLPDKFFRAQQQQEEEEINSTFSFHKPRATNAIGSTYVPVSDRARRT